MDLQKEFSAFSECAECISGCEEAEKRKKEIEYKQSLGTFVVPECTKVKELIKEYVRIYGHGNGSVWSYY